MGCGRCGAMAPPAHKSQQRFRQRDQARQHRHRWSPRKSHGMLWLLVVCSLSDSWTTALGFENAKLAQAPTLQVDPRHRMEHVSSGQHHPLHVVDGSADVGPSSGSVSVVAVPSFLPVQGPVASPVVGAAGVGADPHHQKPQLRQGPVVSAGRLQHFSPAAHSALADADSNTPSGALTPLPPSADHHVSAFCPVTDPFTPPCSALTNMSLPFWAFIIDNPTSDNWRAEVSIYSQQPMLRGVAGPDAAVSDPRARCTVFARSSTLIYLPATPTELYVYACPPASGCRTSIASNPSAVANNTCYSLPYTPSLYCGLQKDCLAQPLYCACVPLKEIPSPADKGINMMCAEPCPSYNGNVCNGGNGTCYVANHTTTESYCQCKPGFEPPACGPIPSPSPSQTPSPTASPSASPTPSRTPSHTPSTSVTASTTPSVSCTPSPSASTSYGAAFHHHAGGNGMSTNDIVLIALAGVVFVLLLVIGIFVCRAQRKKREMNVQDTASPLLGAMSSKLDFSPVKNKFIIPFNEVHIGEQIAAGANGVVYKGVYSNVSVALKEIYCGNDPQVLEQLQKEVTILGNCSHPFIVRLYGASYHHPHLYLITELCPHSLFDQLAEPEQAPPSLDQRIQWGLQIAYGMAFLHSHRIVHRDMKPGNILLDEENNVKICDFGLARITPTRGAMTGFLGTLQYMAPETMSGRRVRYSDKVDVYAFGIIFCELLTWTLAYPETYVYENGSSSGAGDTTYSAIRSTSNATSLFGLRDRVLAGQRPTALDDAMKGTYIVPGLAALGQRPLGGSLVGMESSASNAGGGGAGGGGAGGGAGTTIGTSSSLPAPFVEFATLAKDCWEPDPERRPSFQDVVSKIEAVVSQHGLGVHLRRRPTTSRRRP